MTPATAGSVRASAAAAQALGPDATCDRSALVLAASDGLTGEISRPLNEAAALAITDGTEHITLEHLKRVANADH